MIQCICSWRTVDPGIANVGVASVGVAVVLLPLAGCGSSTAAPTFAFSAAGIKRTAMAILALSWVAICLPGCGGSDGRVKVTGAVSLDGRPLESGGISFQPVDMGSSPGSGGGVAEGQFNLPADKGLRPGKYRVTIEAFKKTGRMFPAPGGGGPSGIPEQVPITFNEADKLEATIVAGADNHFAFQLTTAR